MSNIKNFTRGGQITLHNVRMFNQIMDKLMWVGSIIFIVLSILLIVNVTTAYERYVLSERGWGMVIPPLNSKATTDFTFEDGVTMKVTYDELLQDDYFEKNVHDALQKIIYSLMMSGILSLLTLFLISQALKKYGESKTDNTLIKGDQLLSTHEAAKLIKKKKEASDLQLATLPLIKHAETGHIIFHGTTGSGKSNAIKELLDQIKKRGDRVILYDKSCNFLEEFYDEKSDIILNPLDKRGKPWDLWQECRDSADFDSLAAAQIPMPLSSQDPFWVNAARTIFSAAAFAMRHDEERSIVKLLQTLLTADLESIQKYLKGTEAETLVSDKIEKTAVSIKSVLATYLKCLKYVKEGQDAFSIRRWIQNDKEKSWLFITSLGDRHETLKPLITAWLDIAVNSLLSLAPNDNRRIWLILDELPSLHQLPYLTQTLSESRKFGGCVVVGIQNYAQLAKLYGHEGGREISSLLNTRFMFRQPDPEMAKWAAINFGEAIVDEVREGISYGANTMRDGISMNNVESRKPIVSFSEIMSLPNLSAFVRLPGQFPVVTVKFNYKKREKINESFQKREDFDDHVLKKIDDLLDHYVTTPSPKQKKEKKLKKKNAEIPMQSLTTEFDM